MSTKLLVMDIDNTVFNWVAYYSNSYWALLDKLAGIIGVEASKLASESRDVFEEHGSIEYPFAVQELPSVTEHYGTDIDRMLNEAVEPCRKHFLKVAKPYFKPYEKVHETLRAIREANKDLPLVALTDAPRYVAMWKLNKIGLLPYFSAVYGLADPRIPTCPGTQRVKVSPMILLKHLQQYDFGFGGRIRILPDEYEKPGTRGLKTVLMDYEFDQHSEQLQQVLWVGDNLRKDVQLGHRLGVRTVWASFGAKIAPHDMERLNQFSPPLNIQKNLSVPSEGESEVSPDFEIKTFSELAALI
jgi:FMN phosphatase YigB (HAD superfamily)